MRRRKAALTGVLFALAGSVAALPAQLEQRMPRLPAAQQRELRARDATWTAMTPAQQRAMRQRIADWDALPAAVRRERREHWQAWRNLPADQRLQVQAAAIAFAALAPEQQQALRAQFAQRDASERHGWLLGPALGADLAALQPLLEQVPPDQRESLLATLRGMTVAERLDLATLAQRTPPQRRDALRRELLSTAAANRTAWLQARLAQ